MYFLYKEKQQITQIRAQNSIVALVNRKLFRQIPLVFCCVCEFSICCFIQFLQAHTIFNYYVLIWRLCLGYKAGKQTDNSKATKSELNCTEWEKFDRNSTTSNECKRDLRSTKKRLQFCIWP